MILFKHTSEATRPSVGIFTAILMTIFITELVVMTLLSSLFARLGLYYSSLFDAVILVLLLALPLWLFVAQPLSERKNSERTFSRIYPEFLLLTALTGIFLSEFLVMMILPSIMPHSNHQNISLADASFTTLLNAPLMWWLTCSAKSRKYGISADDMLGNPLRLFFLLLLMFFMSGLLMAFLHPFMLTYISHAFSDIIDELVATLCVAPLLWWFMVKPLMRTAVANRARVKAIYSQAADAIITMDIEGRIESFNPVAEKIFGYKADELAGKAGELLFENDRHSLDWLLKGTHNLGGEAGQIISYEATGRRRDGSLVTIEVSANRILIEENQEYLMIIRDISDRKKLEQEMRLSEERLSLAINGSNDGIWDWDIASGKVYYCPRFNELLGYRADEMEQTFTAFEERLHMDDRARVMESVRNHLEGLHPYDVQYRLINKAGIYRWFRARGQAVRDVSGKAIRMAGSITDINEQKEAEHALRESEERFRQIFEQSDEAIIFFKPDTCSVIDANAAAEKLYGYSRMDMQEDGLKLLTRPSEYTFIANNISNGIQNRSVLLDNVINIRKDGSEIIVSVRGKVMTLQGVDLICCTIRDVTERKRMETEARDIESKLIQTNKMTALGLLVSGIAHEINNPNSFILANSQFLERSWTDALKILREYYRENGEFFIGGISFTDLEANSPSLFAGIIDGSKRIMSIINNLKGFARDTGPYERNDVNVNDVVTSAVSILRYELGRHTDNFHCELADNLPLVKGNKEQLGQIIINLMMNACQALPARQNGIWLKTGFDSAERQVHISVKDEGHGISPDKSSMIMEPFFTTKLDSGGSGLGLSICKSIVKDHNWFMDFTSEPEKGTTFVVRIPVTAAVSKGAST